MPSPEIDLHECTADKAIMLTHKWLQHYYKCKVPEICFKVEQGRYSYKGEPILKPTLVKWL